MSKVQHLREILLSSNCTVEEVMRQFTETAPFTDGRGVALVVDGDRRLLGVVTDGDIRRAFVEGATLRTPVRELMTTSPVVAPVGVTSHMLLRLFDKGIQQIPVLDEQQRVVSLLLYSDFSALQASRRGLLRARAPFRVSFAGGGTDLTHRFESGGGAVISGTINRYAHAMLRTRDDSRVEISSLDLGQQAEYESVGAICYDGTLDLVKAAIRVMRPDYGFSLYTYTDVVPGTGLGSSSSLAVAIIALLYQLQEGELDVYQIADLAYQAERVELGLLGGWQDQYAAAFGGFNFVDFTENDGIVVHPLRLRRRVVQDLEANLLLCVTGQQRSSSKVHRQQKSVATADPALDRKLKRTMVNATLATRDALLKGELVRFGELLHEAWVTKKKYGFVTNPRVDEIYDTARRHGAIGGKILGAGGGGHMLLYCDPLTRCAVAEALKRCQVGSVRVSFDTLGVRVWRGAHDRERPAFSGITT